MRSSCFFIVLFASFVNYVCAQGVFQNWGMTPNGGANGIGVIFSTDSNGGNLTNRYSFEFVNQGGIPYGHLTAFNGKLYGVTSWGSGINATTSSVLFEYDPVAGTYIKKRDLQPADGINNQGSLVVYNNLLYGLSYRGGANNAGVLFSYDPASNNYVKLFELVTATGSQPSGDLTVFNNKMYGTTVNGGSSGTGVLFEFDPVTNIYTSKVNFTGSNGAFPHSSLTFYNNKLYGVTAGGGNFGQGSLFEYDPISGVFNKTVDLTRETGMSPVGGLLVFDNKLWGTTSFGGLNDAGGLFQYDPLTNSYTNKIDFTNEGGSAPKGDLLLLNGKLLGFTQDGGSQNTGVLFEYDPVSNVYTKRIDFTGVNGQHPEGSLTYYNNTIYGLTRDGGANDRGTIFEYNPATYQYTRKVDFSSANGLNPYSSLVYFNNDLYGTTPFGGPNGNAGGVLFKYELATGKETTQFNFDSAGGNLPNNTMILHNDVFYGLTATGGAKNLGVLFSYDPASRKYTKLFDFDSINGKNPEVARLELYNDRLYGITSSGGTDNKGVIFEFDPVSKIFTKKIDFANSAAWGPMDNMLAWNGKFYGGVYAGGLYNKGGIYEYDPVTNTINIKSDFPFMVGVPSFLSLYNNKIYGVSSTGGLNSNGFLFEFDPGAATIVKKIDFFSATGINPFSPLQLRNNLFYGMTRLGGAYNKGVVFEYNPVTNSYSKKADFDGTNGAIPQLNGFVSIPASVAPGIAGSCANTTSFTVDNSNYNNWLPVTDAGGNAVAEINANGNILGIITSSFYVQNSPLRIAGGVNYADRNITITVQNQPAAGQPVSVRLYIKKAELDDLIKTPVAGITSINNIAVYKSEISCSNSIGSSAIKLNTTAEGWGSDFVLTTQVNSFSTFYFAAANAALPVNILSFTAFGKGESVQLNWQTSSEANSHYFDIERSADGISFTKLGTVPASGYSSITRKYAFTDPAFTASIIYYRLKMVDVDGRFVFSKTIKLNNQVSGIPDMWPNPARHTIYVNQSARFNVLQFMDASGKTVLQQSPLASNQYDISRLQPGAYVLRMLSNKETRIMRFVKL